MGRAPVSGVGCDGSSEVRSTGVDAVLLTVAEGATLINETSGASIGYCAPKINERRYCWRWVSAGGY